MRTAIILLSFLVVAGRFFIVPRLDGVPTFSLSYEAFAHLFVGGLFGAFLATMRQAKWGDGLVCLYLGLALTAFELGMFLIQKAAS